MAEGQRAERKQGANMFRDLQAGKSRLASFKKKITDSAWFQKMGAGRFSGGSVHVKIEFRKCGVFI